MGSIEGKGSLLSEVGFGRAAGTSAHMSDSLAPGTATFADPVEGTNDRDLATLDGVVHHNLHPSCTLPCSNDKLCVLSESTDLLLSPQSINAELDFTMDDGIRSAT